MTNITDKNIDQFSGRLLGIAQVLGDGANAKGELLGVNLWDSQGHKLYDSSHKGFRTDLAEITKAFEAWVAADAGSFGIEILVMRMSDHALSGYVDVFPAVLFAYGVS